MTTNERHRGTFSREDFSNEGLPEGAKKFQDRATDKLLSQMWQQEIDFYARTGICIGDRENIPELKEFEVEISGPSSQTFKGELHPKAEGNVWYRGIAVRVDENNPFKQVLIFSGWMQPWITGETQVPIVYTLGNVSDKTVRSIIGKYTSGIAEKIKALRLGTAPE